MDPALKNQIDSDSVNKFSKIASQCLLNNRKRRPSMRVVVKKLEELEKSLELQLSSNTEMNPMLYPRAEGPEGSLIGIHGSNQGSFSSLLKGWPTPMTQKSLIQDSQLFHQSQMLSPQQRLLLSQHNMTSEAYNDESRLLLNNHYMGKDGLSSSAADIPNAVSQMGVLPRADPDMLIKLRIALIQQQQQLQQQHQQQQQQQQQQQKLLSVSDQQQHPKKLCQVCNKSGCLGCDYFWPDPLTASESTKGQTGRKRKQLVPSSGPDNSSGMAGTSTPLMMFRPDGKTTLTSSMRLQKIRPPPLEPINVIRPQMPVRPPDQYNMSRPAQLPMSGATTAESPISAYMRYLQQMTPSYGPRINGPPVLASPTSPFVMPSPSV